MPRSRFWHSVLLLGGLVVITYLLISFYLPSSRWLIFGIDKNSGRVRRVEQRVTYLPPYQFYRLKFEKREGYAQRDGLIRITSKEGVPVTVTYRLRFGISGDRIADARRVVNEGWNAWIRARVSEAVSAVTSQIPIEDLLSPTSQFNVQQRALLRQTVARHLAQSGLQVTAFEIARFEVDKEELLRVKRAELRRDARSAPTRVAIFALDGADWELLSELANDDRTPNLKALTQGGTSGSVQTIQPTVSSMLWTTAATGLPPDRHGVIDFIDWAHHAPVDAYSRRAPALWDIADAFGRQSLVANWWTAWPPAARNSIFFDEPVQLVPNAIFPPDVAARAESQIVPTQTVGYDQVHRFMNILPAEWDRATSSNKAADPINIFRDVLSKTWSDHRVAINVYNDQRQHGRDPLLIMVSYEGTDAINHLFSPFHPPYRDGISQDGYRRFWPTVASYYAEIDRLIGEWMNVLPRDTTVMIVSTYGFRWGKDRPREVPSGGAALSDHRNPGVFLAYGPHITPSRSNHALSIYDIAPTVLTLLGLPQSTEMPGRPATWALHDLQPITSVRVVSYSEFVSDRPIATQVHVDAQRYQRELQAIGHLNDTTRTLTGVLENQNQPAQAGALLPPDKWATYAYYNNLGVELSNKGRYKEAIDAFKQAIELNPNHPTPYLNLAIALFNRQDYTDAIDVFLEAVAKGLPNAESYFVDFAALFRQKEMNSRAIALLEKGKELFPQSYAIAANLGSALVAANRYSEGIPELERALGMQPSSTTVLNNLGIYYAKKDDYARALDYWNRSLSIEPHQPQIRQAVDAARTRL
jgi:predicted AlkP superfamily phosphohydrolase/phosphomutase/Flp pilus assembly protein TadD